MLLTIFLLLLIVAIASLIFSLVDTESPYAVHIVSFTLTIAIFLFLGFQCLFNRIVIDFQWFYQNLGLIGILLIAFATVLFVYVLFEYANTVKMERELREEKEVK